MVLPVTMTSATGSSNKIRARRPHAVVCRGLTLIELLVVMVIIGVVFTGGVVLLDRGLRGQLQLESERLSAMLGLAREEAMLKASHYGIGFWRQGYGFYHVDSSGSWQRLHASALRDRTLAAPLRLRVWLDGQPLDLPDGPPKAPQVWLLASGETLPFALELDESDGKGRRLRMDSFGQGGWHDRTP